MNEGRVWGVNRNYGIFTRNGSNDSRWYQVGGYLKQIAVASEGRVWGVNRNNDVYTRSGINDSRWHKIAGKLTRITVARDGRVWGIDANNCVHTRHGVNGAWQKIDGQLRSISVTDSGRIWAVDIHDDIYTRDGINGSWQPINGKAINISATIEDRLWAVDFKNDVYTRDGIKGSWQKIDDLKLEQIAVANNGRVWGVNTDGHIYTRDGLDGVWQLVKGNLTWISVAEIVVSVMAFDGDDYIEVPYSDLLNPNQFTVSCWANVQGGTGSWRSVITSRNHPPHEGYIIYAGINNKWQFWTGDGRCWPVVSGPDIAPNTWTHLAITFNGTDLKFYVDGQLTQTSGNYLPNPSRPLRIGAGATEQKEPTMFFPGKILEVSVWNLPRSQEEIQQDMHCRLTGNEPGLMGYWPLNGDAFDKTSNGNHGEIHGAVFEQENIEFIS